MAFGKGVNLEKTFTAKDAKDARENKGRSNVCRIVHLVFASHSTSPLIPFASFAVQSLEGLPVVAIGGITVDNAPQLIAAGADSVAVITAVFGAADIEAAARQFSTIFSR
jgi:thiamine-phosphate pyrophosphorylase